MNDPQVSANAMAVTPSDPSIKVPVLINHPINVDHLNKVGPVRAPSLGEHSKQILSELGVAEADVDELLSDGVVVSTPPPS